MEVSQDLGSSCPHPVLGSVPAPFSEEFDYIHGPRHSLSGVERKKILSSDLYFDPIPKGRYGLEANKHTQAKIFPYAALNQGALFSSSNFEQNHYLSNRLPSALLVKLIPFNLPATFCNPLQKGYLASDCYLRVPNKSYE